MTDRASSSAARRRPGTTSLRDDRHISSPAEDRLNLGDFVSRLARSVMEAASDSSLVVGLYGRCGEGKSSILGLLEHELKRITQLEGAGARERREPIVVRFTPWLYDSVATLLDAFFATMKRGVGGDIPRSLVARRRWLHAVQGMESSFAAVRPLFGDKAAVGTAATATALVAGAAVAGGVRAVSAGLIGAVAGLLVSLLVAAVSVASGGEQDFDKYKARAARVLARLSRRGRPLRVVVLIDDLDRADGPQIVAMLRLIKLVADLPNVTYVVAMDNEKVAEILEQQRPGAYGADFLEKIVQVVVHVPPVSISVLEKIVMGDARSAANAAGISSQPLGEPGESDLRPNDHWLLVSRRVRTIRDANRLLNAYDFMLHADGPNAELHAGDALLIAFLQVFMPRVYQAVRRDRGERIEALAGLAVSGPARGPDDHDAVALTVKVLRKLFPNAEDVDRPDSSVLEHARQGRRIQIPEYFDGYFRLVPSVDDAPARVVEAVAGVMNSSVDSSAVSDRIGTFIAPPR